MPGEHRSSHSKSRSKSESKSRHTHSSRKTEEQPQVQSQAPEPQPAAQPVVVQGLQPSNQIVCENCGKQAQTFCPSCDLLLCQQCFSQIHANVALQQHCPVSGNLINLFTKTCNLHGKRCRYVCLSCNLYCCDQCRAQLHVGVQHQVMPIQDAFYTRLNALSGLAQSQLGGKQHLLQESLFKF